MKKRVLVVGGGPAGMEAARIAALRGHDVTLYDKGQELGGALFLAAAPPGKEKIETFRNYLEAQLSKAKVKVKLGTEVTPELVEKENPDALVVATGSRPLIPKSFAGKHVLTAWDVLGGKSDLSNKKAVVVGGGMVGAETAEYLAHRGNDVTIVEMLPSIAGDMQISNRAALLRSLKELGVKMLTRRKVMEVVEGGIMALDKDSGRKTFIDGDVIVLALGALPNTDLADAVEGKVAEVYTIGDCNQPRIIMEAVYEGSMVGRGI